jgi:hypothetical protein
MSARTRGIAEWTLIVAASTATVLALLVGYVQRAAVNSDQFANRATAALRDESVRSLIAQRVTDDLVLEHAPDLVTARPLIQSVVSSAVGGPAFTGIFRTGVRDVHRALFDRDEHTLTLTLRDMGIAAAAALEATRPALAQQVRTDDRVDLITRDVGRVGADAARAADTVRFLAWLFALLALPCGAGALWLAADRRRTVVRLGVGLAVGGLLIVFGLRVARDAAIDHMQGADARDAARAVWNAFLSDLTTAAWTLAASGVVVAAAAASLIPAVDIRAPLRRVGAGLLRQPARPAVRALRAAALVAVGVICLLTPDAVLRLAIGGAGLLLVYSGLIALLELINHPRPTRAKRRHRGVIAGVIAAVLIVAAAGTFVGAGGTSTAAPPPVACNGHEALCSRSLDEVALPATHNSMSAPLPGWFSSQQDRSIPEQLADGIRGLLIDTHYADLLPNGRLRTELSDARLQAKGQLDGVSPQAVDAALRTRERLGFAGNGKRGMYLCHSFCELGGTPLEPVLQDLHDFLVANPGEVVVVINEDYVMPQDFVAAVEAAGLARFVYRGPTSTGGWPTLRKMIDDNQRLVLMAENRAGGAPWYHPVYEEITQETPFSFRRTAQLTDPAKLTASCAPNRGPDGAPIFLVNHWITTDPAPRPSNAEAVNAYEPLLRRLEACRRIRDHIPNLVAVDFYRQGDLLRAVDTLNNYPRLRNP